MKTKYLFSFCLLLASGLLPCFSRSKLTRQQQIEAYDRQAAEYLKENKPDLAVPQFRAIIALDPNSVNAHGNLGAVLFFEGDYAAAIPQMRAALKLKPTLWKIQALLGIAEKRTGDVSASRHDLEEAFPNVPDQKVRIETGMELIEIYSASGDLDKAASTVSALRKLEPTDQTVLYSAYRLYSDLADEALLSLSVVAPNSARMNQALAHELAKRGNTAEAIEHYRAALKLDPQLPGLDFELADMLNTLGTDEGRHEAESEYRAALEVNPRDEQSERRLGDLAFRTNDLKTAADDYTRAIELQPNDSEANIGLAKVEMSLNHPQRAEELLQHAIQLDPTIPVAHFRLSTIYRQTGRPEEAKHEIEEYQKYNEMKEKLRAVYRDLHRDQAGDENDDAESQK